MVLKSNETFTHLLQSHASSARLPPTHRLPFGIGQRLEKPQKGHKVVQAGPLILPKGRGRPAHQQPNEHFELHSLDECKTGGCGALKAETNQHHHCTGWPGIGLGRTGRKTSPLMVTPLPCVPRTAYRVEDVMWYEKVGDWGVNWGCVQLSLGHAVCGNAFFALNKCIIF